MGLDLLPMSKPKRGFEDEYLAIVEKQRREHPLSEAEITRFRDNTIAPYETLGAPRVGFDLIANEWMIKSSRAELPTRQILSENHGYFVLELLENCAGVQKFSNGGLYEGIDRTSFRGAFFHDCSSFLPKRVIEEAYQKVRTPGEAVAFGDRLLKIASGEPIEPKRTFLNSIFGLKKPNLSLAEQTEILNAAGHWY